ncbi:CAP domain-containing protein [Candidatus Saccharibacteria bacterium]|nr:CAP domain-containing protein [Candidatus Saccharibacteria bacterium]NCU40197.1 CAP domain-containing protein [Candidatus Saccharibacteria bacterium]
MIDKNPQNHTLFHLSRMLLSGLLLVSVLLARSNITALTLASQSNNSTGSVLAYATNMSIGDLLTAANMSRQANGLPALQLNGQLNSSAQAKANHMISFDYWAHVAPDGTEPWYFFNQAGYNYLRAGENLAYGFNTGFEVNTGWMNSTTHRENILGDYADVGFGIANGVNYQGSENTVVVAHYGKPVSPPPVPAPAPAPTAPVVAPTVTPTPTTTVTTESASNLPDTTDTQAEETASTPVAETEKPKPDKSSTKQSDDSPTANLQNKSKAVSVLEQLSTGNSSAAVYASLGIVTLSSAGYAMTHRLRMKHLLKKGKKLALHHPMLDLTLIGTALIFILSANAGYLL